MKVFQAYFTTRGWLVYVLVFIFIVAKLLFAIDYSLTREFIMDEFSQAYKARLLDEFYHEYLPIKNVLYAYYYAIPHLFTSESMWIAKGARVLSLICFLVNVIVVYFIVKKIYKKEYISFLAIAILLSFTTFIEHAITIRSETLSLVFANVALLVLLFAIQSVKRKSVAEYFVGFFLGLSFLCTQKAVYFVLAYGIAAIIFNKNFIANSIAAWKMALGFLATIAIYAIYFSPTDPVSVIRIMLIGPLDVALNAVDYYPTINSYREQTYLRNMFAYWLYFAAVIYSLLKYNKITDHEKIVMIISIILGLFIYNHNQPWPYNFILFIPIASIVAVKLFNFRFLYSQAFIAVSLIILSMGFFRNIYYSQRTNDLQLKVIEQAENLLNEDETYFDGIGMILSRDRAAPHLGLDRMTSARIIKGLMKGDQSLMNEFYADNPKLWINTYRMNYLSSTRGDLRLRRSYFQVYQNIYLTGGCSFDGKELLFDNNWEGEYQLYSIDGEILNNHIMINSVLHKPIVALERKTYKLGMLSNTPFCVFPKGLKLPRISRNNLYSVRIFAGAYE